MTVLPNGVAADDFSKASFNAGLREQMGGGEFLVGFLGSMKPWHGLEILLEAFHGMPGKGADRLVFIGDGPLSRDIREQSANLGIEDRVTLTGPVDHQLIPEYLKAADVLVAPYPQTVNFYFSPIKIFEYMASGRPMVASRVGQVAEILEHEKNALLVPPGDTAALTKALLRLKSDQKLGVRLAQAAEQEVKSAHTWAARFQTIEPAFSELISRFARRDLVPSRQGAST